MTNLAPDHYAELTERMCSHVNVGSGQDLSIRELSETIKRVTGYQGQIRFDATKPDGPPRKLLDVSRLRGLGWQARIELEQGLAQTYQWFVENLEQVRG